MSPETHRRILLGAMESGDWQGAERATRSRAWHHLFATLRGLLARLVAR